MTNMRDLFKERSIAVPEEDYPILQAQWMWLSSLKDRTKDLNAGSFDIAITHPVGRKNK